MLQKRTIKLTILIAMLSILFSFWDHSIIRYLKEYIVLIHEMNHAIATILTGGSVQDILLHGNESGETIAIPNKSVGLSFIFIVSSGYIGCFIIGSLLMQSGFRGILVRPIFVLLGLITLFLTINYSKVNSFAYVTGLSWAFLLLGLGILNLFVNRIILVFLGTSISLYSLYDLFDFTHGVQSTDAGILASWILGYQGNYSQEFVIFLSYLIGLSWSLFCLGILFYSIKHLFRKETPNEPHISAFPGEVTPEVLAWLQEKGLDANGNPIQKPEKY